MHRSSKLVFSYQWMTLWFFLSLIFLTWPCILSNVGIVNLNILLVFVWLLILEVLLSFPTCIYFFLSYLFLENVFQSPFSAFQESSAYFQMFLDYFSSLGVNFPCGYPLSTLSWVHFFISRGMRFLFSYLYIIYTYNYSDIVNLGYMRIWFYHFICVNNIT